MKNPQSISLKKNYRLVTAVVYLWMTSYGDNFKSSSGTYYGRQWVIYYSMTSHAVWLFLHHKKANLLTQYLLKHNYFHILRYSEGLHPRIIIPAVNGWHKSYLVFLSWMKQKRQWRIEKCTFYLQDSPCLECLVLQIYPSKESAHVVLM